MFLKFQRNNTVLKKAQQRGAALVVAMLIVLLVVSLSVSVSGDFMLMFRRVENQIHSQQAQALLMGAEGLGRQAVVKDIGTEIDHRSEGWLEQLIVFPHDYGVLEGTMSDLQGRINLNNLKNEDQAIYNADQERFIRLLQVLELKVPIGQAEAVELANGIFDWLDANDEERSPGGAESLFYGDAELAGRAGNKLMASVSELRWVKGMTLELYEALLPHITVWGSGVININTATDKVLQSLNKKKNLEPLSLADIDVLIEGQKPEDGGFDDTSIFSEASLVGFGIDTSGLDVKSDMFLLASTVIFLEREYQLNSVIKREADGAVVVARSAGAL